MPHVAGFRGVTSSPASGTVPVAPVAPVAVTQGLADGSLVRDASRAVYRYHQTFAGPGRSLTRKTTICAVRLADWSEGQIRPHEETTASARDAALERIRTRGAHTEPVLFGIRDPASEIERLFRKAEGDRPTLSMTTADGTLHKMWTVHDAEVIGKLRNYLTPKKLHLLDGHATYEAMLAYRDELAQRAPLLMYASANYGLGHVVTFDDPGLVVAARHRVLRGLTVDREAVLAAARSLFIIERLAGVATDVGKLLTALGDNVAHQPAFIVAFAGEADAWKLTLSPDVSPINEGVAAHRAIQKYDPIVVEHLFVARHLAGAEASTETDAGRAIAALADGAAVAILQRPLSLEQIAHADELDQRLPPSSTAFHPAIAAGLVSLIIDPDEDLA